MEENRKKILHYSLTLFIITAVVALLLTCVNMLTEGVIGQNGQDTLQKAMQSVMPNVNGLEKLDAAIVEEYGAKQIYAATLDGRAAGYCIELLSAGYGGDIDIVVGVDLAATVSGIHIVSHSETPGLGANIANSTFTDQYLGRQYDPDRPITAVKGNAADMQVNAVSGATISSKAVTAAVNRAMEIAAKLSGSQAD